MVPERFVLVVSPLEALERDQVCVLSLLSNGTTEHDDILVGRTSHRKRALMLLIFNLYPIQWILPQTRLARTKCLIGRKSKRHRDPISWEKAPQYKREVRWGMGHFDKESVVRLPTRDSRRRVSNGSFMAHGPTRVRCHDSSVRGTFTTELERIRGICGYSENLWEYPRRQMWTKVQKVGYLNSSTILNINSSSLIRNKLGYYSASARWFSGF